MQADKWLPGANGIAILDQPFQDRGRERGLHVVAVSAHLDVSEV
jgi:hypothetical protein